MARKGRIQQTSLRFSFISTVLSHIASSVDFNNSQGVLENEPVFTRKMLKFILFLIHGFMSFKRCFPELKFHVRESFLDAFIPP